MADPFLKRRLAILSALPGQVYEFSFPYDSSVDD